MDDFHADLADDGHTDLADDVDGEVEEVPRPGFSASGSSSSSGPESSSPDPPRVRRRPIPRKGHTKSRRGCLQCKRRKVKCQETLPECDHCRRIGLKCEYPPGPGSGRELTPSPTRALNGTPTTFSIEDLRFFQHFLLTAYPPLPIQGDAVWRDVAVISHHFDFLIHAMLGLAASHLTLMGGADYGSQALAHRVAAIQAVKESLSRPCSSAAEGDARFATMMALAFQSACMDEGMLEFFGMIRGCGVVGQSGAVPFGQSLFGVFSLERHLEAVQGLQFARPADENVSPLARMALSGEYVDDFLASLHSLAPLCRSPIEVSFLAKVERVAKAAKTSPMQAFSESSELYSIITDASHDDYSTLVHPDNHAAQLMFVHFFVIEYVSASQVLGPIVERSFPFRKKLVLPWLERVRDALPPDYLQYMEWPMSFAAKMVEFDQYLKRVDQ